MQAIKFPVFNFLARTVCPHAFHSLSNWKFDLFWINITIKHKFCKWKMALPLLFVMYQTEKNCYIEP